MQVRHKKVVFSWEMNIFQTFWFFSLFFRCLSLVRNRLSLSHWKIQNFPNDGSMTSNNIVLSKFDHNLYQSAIAVDSQTASVLFALWDFVFDVYVNRKQSYSHYLFSRLAIRVLDFLFARMLLCVRQQQRVKQRQKRVRENHSNERWHIHTCMQERACALAIAQYHLQWNETNQSSRDDIDDRSNE